MLGVQIEYVADDGAGNQTLQLYSSGFAPQATAITSDSTDQLATLTTAATPTLTMLPLAGGEITWAATC